MLTAKDVGHCAVDKQKKHETTLNASPPSLLDDRCPSAPFRSQSRPKLELRPARIFPRLALDAHRRRRAGSRLWPFTAIALTRTFCSGSIVLAVSLTFHLYPSLPPPSLSVSIDLSTPSSLSAYLYHSLPVALPCFPGQRVRRRLVSRADGHLARRSLTKLRPANYLGDATTVRRRQAVFIAGADSVFDDAALPTETSMGRWLSSRRHPAWWKLSQTDGQRYIVNGPMCTSY